MQETTPLPASPLHLHGSVVALGEAGVLIRGASGAGKSSLALALVEAWRSRGDFASLVGDDRVALRLVGGRALLSPHPLAEGLAEWRGIGLITREFEPRAVLALIVDLEPLDAHSTCPRLPEPAQLFSDFHGLHDIARLRLPAGATERSVAAIMAFLHKATTK